ncbi:hypothetical protein HK097_007074 [Rhizophlyctis rosea]|uniref:GH15-like domain-containing protein n=1 Tax=Rhizophlyctis rosea TaxID=64517 RepID=A0AAD5SE97_9FUNG|nr:hypothetical protein HK097_007074 [Rhizophlyctis rosea]
MHVPEKSVKPKPLQPWVVRQVECIRGKYKVKVECFPAFDYARAKHTTEVVDMKDSPFLKRIKRTDGSEYVTGNKRVVFTCENGLEMDLRHVIHCTEDSLLGVDTAAGLNPNNEFPKVKWQVEQVEGMLGPGAWAELDLIEGQKVTFVFREVAGKAPEGCTAQTDPGDPALSQDLLDGLYKATAQFWLKWIGQSKYTGRWREVVHRSALMLKLLTYQPTGAVVAAPTFGIPEEIGGERNWDYRYVWIRDSAFTIYAFVRIGLTEEAEAYMQFMQARMEELKPDGSLQVMYSIDGAHELPEFSLDHLEGYRNSRPVRIGNGAFDHLQLDIYGALLDAVYLYNKYRNPISYDTWCDIRKIVNYVCDNWNVQDMSIWEVRGMKQHFLYSKIMCWVAIDRGLRLVDKRSLPCPDRNKWLQVRDEIYEAVMTKGWDKKRKMFVQSFEAQEDGVIDSAVLIMPLVFFISPTDPRLLSTIKEMMKPPEKGGLLANNLMYRYDHSKFNDGLTGAQEGSFSMCKSKSVKSSSYNPTGHCTFWLVEALTRAGQHRTDLLRQAMLIFEQMIAYGNHLALFSEEIARSGEMLGNFPQAFTHIALMSAAFNLDRVLSGAKVE